MKGYNHHNYSYIYYISKSLKRERKKIYFSFCLASSSVPSILKIFGHSRQCFGQFICARIYLVLTVSSFQIIFPTIKNVLKLSMKNYIINFKQVSD